jgi:hypothetical protein
MTPRAGGEADKFGNRYESAWTVRQLLAVLAGNAESITVEEPGEIGEGVEFRVQHLGARDEVHQVKRQRGTATSWTLRDLNNEGVLASAARHVEAGREFHFVSMIPARALERLCGRARRSADLQAFVTGQLDGEQIKADFDFLCADDVWGAPERAWEILRGTYVGWPDERDIRATNATLASFLLCGATGDAAAASLADLVLNHTGVPLTATETARYLSHYSLVLHPLAGDATLAERVNDLTESWVAGLRRELLDPRISRDEPSELVARLAGEQPRPVVAVGAAGGGKSGVLLGVAERVKEAGWTVLAFRLDRWEPARSAAQLGDHLGLGVSPVTALAAATGDGRGLLVIDQLDAVSLASGRMPESFDAVADLLAEASAFRNLAVLLACREFDVNNDHHLRGLVSHNGPAVSFPVPPLSQEQVQGAVERMGLDPDSLSEDQIRLLSVPLHLVLLHAVADEAGALNFATTKDLFDAFFDRKRRDAAVRRNRDTRFAEVVGVLSDAMSDRQRLSVPASTLDRDNLHDDADLLTSEHVLVRDGSHIAFFHEAFFDYAFARRWTTRDESLVEFLTRGEQELFRRAQVRQILAHLREDDPRRFITEVREVLTSPSIRFHIQEVVLALLNALPDPTKGEWEAIEHLLTNGNDLNGRLWMSLRAEPWMRRLDQEGVLARWLASGDPDLEARALEVMISGAKVDGDRMAELLSPHTDHPDYPRWLAWVIRFADLHASRKLFDVVQAALRAGHFSANDHDLWLSCDSLGDHRPDWAVELIHVFLADRPESAEVNDEGEIPFLRSTEYGALELIRQSANQVPEVFCATLIPDLLNLMGATSAGSDEEPRRDKHFGYRHYNQAAYHVDQALINAASRALRAFAASDPEGAAAIIDSLAKDRHDAAQWLLYEALRANGPAFADRAGQILLEGPHRLRSGYLDDSYWTTRQLLEAITPHLPGELFARLEAGVIDFKPEWETPEWRGYTSFVLLSAFHQSRLSERGRKVLGELQRRFEREVPEEPMGIRTGIVGSPIPQAATERMSDDQWRRAIAKYAGPRDWTPDFRGGADQLAQVLQQQTAKDPERFAQLALTLPEGTNPAYIRATLMGLGETTCSVPPGVVYAVIRTAARLEDPDVDRFLGRPLQPIADVEIPEDIIALLIERASQSTDPVDDAWRRDTSEGGPSYGGDPLSNGINTARGGLAWTLGDLLLSDTSGDRTALISPALVELARDPSIAVRACVARTIAATLRHAEDPALEAFDALVEDDDDRLLAADTVERLIAYVGYRDPDRVRPVIEKMLTSEHNHVREAGGRLAAYAGLELGLGDFLTQAVDSSDAAVRKGAAAVCAGRLPHTANSAGATNGVRRLLYDDDPEVRKAAGSVAASLRGADLGAFSGLLADLIASPAFPDALTQLLFSLEEARGPLGTLPIAAAQRFLELYRDEAGDIRTGAAGDARHIAQLLVRAYADAPDAETRARALDLIDEMLRIGAYGVGDVIAAAER